MRAGRYGNAGQMDVGSAHLSPVIAFLVIGAAGLIDGVFPLVPARTAMIGVGVLAGDGNWLAYPLLAVGTAAVFVSDNVAYWLGARYWDRIQGILLRGSRSRRLWAWVERQMNGRGTMLVVLARVIPGGPTPITLTAGAVEFPRRRFLCAAAAGAILWSAFAFSLGLFGDTIFGQRPLIALLSAVAVAAGVDWGLRVALRRRQ